MLKLPRFAVGTVQLGADLLPMVWALSSLLERSGAHVQVFQSKACLGGRDGGPTICGRAARHLDSWLVPSLVCREMFVHGSQGADVSLVMGHYDRGPTRVRSRESSLQCLCEWLDLPQVAIVDVSQLRDCRLPELPSATVALLLDRVVACDLPRWQTILEPLYNVPVLGALPRMPAERRMLERLSAGDSPSRCLCAALANRLGETLRLRQLLHVTVSSALPAPRRQLFRSGSHLAGVHVAVAYDEAFHGYFPDVLDLLELQGAVVRDFSPLRDETLPAGTDIVYIGCGHPQRYARSLAENQCLALALRNHVCQGRRLYAEGGGLAYLCRYLLMPSGKRWPMAGVMPAAALRAVETTPPQPTELLVSQDNWLAPRGARLRGYRHTAWNIMPSGPFRRYDAGPGYPADLMAHQQAIGSRLQIDFAAQPDFLNRFSTGRSGAPNPLFAR